MKNLTSKFKNLLSALKYAGLALWFFLTVILIAYAKIFLWNLKYGDSGFYLWLGMVIFAIAGTITMICMFFYFLFKIEKDDDIIYHSIKK